MEVEFDRSTCAGWFQCIQHWDAFDMNTVEGKADLKDSTVVEPGVFRRTIPEEKEEKVKKAAEKCPVDAILVFDDDDE